MTKFTEQQIEAAVSAFLQWKLPDSVCSDTCVSDITYATRYPDLRSGTNLLTADEARQMVTHVCAALLAAAPAPASDGWRPIESAPSAKAVLVAYTNRSGKRRVVKAVRYEQFQSEQEFDEFDTVEYCEAKDAYFIPAGWYEMIDNWDDFSSVSITEGKPAFWCDLPTPPAQEEGK